jgi:hypothetical protein
MRNEARAGPMALLFLSLDSNLLWPVDDQAARQWMTTLYESRLVHKASTVCLHGHSERSHARPRPMSRFLP